MTARTFQHQGMAPALVGARAAVRPMACHATPDFGWSYDVINGLGSTAKPGAPPG